MKRFLERFLEAWRGFSRGEHKFDRPLSNEEPLTRYIYHRGNLFRVNPPAAKRGAFMPPPGNLSLSVFRTQGLGENAIWSIAARHVMPNPKARADIPVADVSQTGLVVEPDNIPPRHAIIVGWPDGKDARMERALDLAKRAVLIFGPGFQPRG